MFCSMSTVSVLLIGEASFGAFALTETETDTEMVKKGVCLNGSTNAINLTGTSAFMKKWLKYD